MEQQLRKLQLTQLEILKFISAICEKHDIKYSLYAGTLLGAVRHKGFIPWDDDLDICMERSEYDRFIALWDTIDHEGYILQNKENSPRFSQSFTKIRKDHTTFLQSEKEIGAYHTGIFVDVFPIDRRPNGKINNMIFQMNCMLYQLFTREFVPPKGSRMVRFGAGILLQCIQGERRKKVRYRLQKQLTKYNDNRELGVAAIETVDSARIRYPSTLLDKFTRLRFEDAEWMCFAEWDIYLKKHFGDYMQFPPESERVWKHHPILIDFEKNYEEISAK